MADAVPPPGKARLVALDLDGTLLCSDQTFRPAVVAAVTEAVEAGVTVILCTGRADPSARQFHRQLNLRGPLISYQGAVVAGPNGRRWYDIPVPAESVAPAVHFAEQRGDELTFYHADRVYFRRERQEPQFYSAWFGLPRIRLDDWSGLPGVPTKMLIIAGNDLKCDEVSGAWSQRFVPGLCIVRSHPLFVEAVAPEVSKGRALAWLAKRLDIEQSQTLAVGDNENDISMLDWAGVGVAIGGAPATVVAAADVVAPPLEEDGGAWALRRYALGLEA